MMFCNSASTIVPAHEGFCRLCLSNLYIFMPPGQSDGWIIMFLSCPVVHVLKLCLTVPSICVSVTKLGTQYFESK